MPTFLIDPSTTTYLLFGTMAIILGAIWFSNRNKKMLLGFLGVLALIVLIYFCDLFVESPREQGVRKIHEMAEATQSRQLDRLLRHISDQFKYGSIDKKGLESRFRSLQARSDWRGGAVWDLDRRSFQMIDDNTFTQGFNAKAVDTAFIVYAVATFKKEGADDWKMSSIRFYDFQAKDSGPAKAIPEFGSN